MGLWINAIMGRVEIKHSYMKMNHSNHIITLEFLMSCHRTDVYARETNHMGRKLWGRMSIFTFKIYSMFKR